MGRWWAAHENGPSDKYRHYYWDRKAKCTQTHKHTIKNSALIRDGGGRVIKNAPHFKYRHYHKDRKKIMHTHTGTHTHTKQQK